MDLDDLDEILDMCNGADSLDDKITAISDCPGICNNRKFKALRKAFDAFVADIETRADRERSKQR